MHAAVPAHPEEPEPSAGRYGAGMSETGDPINPEDDEAEAAEPAEESTGDNPDLDEE